MNFSTQVTLDSHPALASSTGPVARYVCPRGQQPGLAQVLLARDSVAQISGGSADRHTLTFTTRVPGEADQTVALPGLVYVSAERIFPGAAGDPAALYRVTLADPRALLTRFSDTGKLAFNLRSFAQAADYLSETDGLDWADTIETVWDTMSSILGAFPGLPSGLTLTGVPENLHFDGQNSWHVLHRLLERIGLTTAYDPLDDSFSMVPYGEQTLGTPPWPPLLLDNDPLPGPAAMLPETVRVYFHTHYKNFGQERDTQLDDHYLTGAHCHMVEVPTGIATAQAGTVLPLWDDLPAVRDEANLLENLTQLEARAAAVTAATIARLQANQPRSVTLPGIVDAILPGGQISGITWEVQPPGRGGSTTRIDWADAPPLVFGQESASSENWHPPDLARPAAPAFPRLINAVQAWGSSAEPGEPLEPNGDGLVPGRVVRWVAGSLVTLENCWLRPISLETGEEPDPQQVVSLRHADRFIARLCGVQTSGGNTLPLYLVQTDQPQPTGQVYWGACQQDKTEWDSGCTTVNVARADACHDPEAEGEIYAVVLPRIADVIPNLHIGDTIGFSQVVDTDDQTAGYVCVSDYTKSPGAESFEALWGEVEEAVLDWASTGCTVATVTRVANCQGAMFGDGTQQHQVILPKLADKLPRLQSGDIIAYLPTTASGAEGAGYVIVSDYTISTQTAGPRWAVCSSDSQDGGAGDGLCDAVLVRDAADPAGGGVDGGQTPFKVLLPRRERFSHCLQSGEVIAYELAADNTPVIQADYSSGPTFENACLEEPPEGEDPVPGVALVTFDTAAGFVVGPGGPKQAQISLIGPEPTMLWQPPAPAATPHWTDTIRLARMLILGDSQQPGALLLGTCGLAAPNGGNYLLLLPDQAPTAAGQVPYIHDIGTATAPELPSGTTAALRFSQPGVSGSAAVAAGDLLEFEAGICIKWEDSLGTNKLSPPTASEEADINLGEASVGELCEEA